MYHNRFSWYVLVLAGLLGPISSPVRAWEIESDPIRYSKTKADNTVTRLMESLKDSGGDLKFTEAHGYLESLLKKLDVPQSSQVLVFSKTSLQRHRISPKTPRAIYFNDEVYIGFCRLGDVLEISAVDPCLGTIFYTLDQEPVANPRIRRQNDNCMICHASSHNQGLPGHLVRSIYPDRDGNPILSGGSHRVDHTTPFKERWGGWYVTGTHGKQTHLGNLIVPTRFVPDQVDNSEGQNVKQLKGRFDIGAYLTPHSDLVALMVLEHQAEMHNRITAASYLSKFARYDSDIINKVDGIPTGGPLTESGMGRIRSAVEPLVKYMLFSGEAPLEESVQGSSSFAQDFAKRGPFDTKGRSLRDFDLKTRMFRYPCSYLIYSASFDQLPDVTKQITYQRLWDVLSGKDTSKEFAHLTAEDRQAIREILRETKKGLPSYWK